MQLGPKVVALREEYMRYAVEKCASILKEYRSALETLAGLNRSLGQAFCLNAFIFAKLLDACAISKSHVVPCGLCIVLWVLQLTVTSHLVGR